VEPHEPDRDLPPTQTRTISPTAFVVALVLGAVAGGMVVEYWMTRSVPKPSAQQASPAPSSELAADVEHLKSVVPTQSHTMTDVGYHWANLWFAAEKKNWPLAKFFFDEARQHIRWTILIRPVRQKADGGTVDIKGIFTAMDMSTFAAVQLAIEDESDAEFVPAYKQALEACHACHVAAEKPYLRPVIPTAPPSTLIDFTPQKK